MELCYDGALVMPSNYAVMSEEEMTYTEGGTTVMSKSQCCDGLAKIGIASPQIAIAGALTYTLATKLINKVATVAGVAAKVISLVLSWAVGQVVQLGVAIARGALNKGVSIWWNWNVFKEPIGVNYSVRC